MSIEAKDLRIGNWVILDWNGDKRPQTIAAINRTNFEMQDWDKQFDAFDLYPIPLTPEILEKCGLTSHLYNDRDGYWEKDWFILEGINNTGLYFGKMTKVKYLHQLQNLYWCLCGEELQIKNLTNEQRQ